MADLNKARIALRERQGSGARYDDPAAPAQVLSWARLGTAYFARKLNDLSNEELVAENQHALRLRRIICRVGYEARALAETVELVRASQSSADQTNLHDDPFTHIDDAIQLGVTLPAAAIRHLFKHSEVHLNVEWRDLAGEEWDAAITFNNNRHVIARSTVWERARAIWLRANDLDKGLGKSGSFRSFPPDLNDALLNDAASDWTGDSVFLLRPTDRDYSLSFGDAASAQVISGLAADLAQWITGRGENNIKASATLPAHSFSYSVGDA